MDLSLMVLLTGLLISGIGFLMVLFSLKASPDEVKQSSKGVIFIGSIPLIFGGNRRWITLVLVTAVILVFFILRLDNPGITGW